MDNELTQPLGELSPLYSLGTEFTKQRGGTGHVVTDEDTNALRLATKIMQNQDQELAPNRITAYHGSPHEFDEFDTAKIGTGEGNQSYGHGLYFAEAEPTARHYQELLSSGNPTLSGRVKSVLAEHNGDENAAKGYIQQAIDLLPDNLLNKNIKAICTKTTLTRILITFWIGVSR